MNLDPELEPDPYIANPLATLGVLVNPGSPHIRLGSNLDAPPPFDPDDEELDQAAFEAAFEVVFLEIQESPDAC